MGALGYATMWEAVFADVGVAPNAMANMGAVTEKFGSAPRAMLIVPLVGAFLVDIIHIPNIIWFINYFK